MKKEEFNNWNVRSESRPSSSKNFNKKNDEYAHENWKIYQNWNSEKHIRKKIQKIKKTISHKKLKWILCDEKKCEMYNLFRNVMSQNTLKK